MGIGTVFLIILALMVLGLVAYVVTISIFHKVGNRAGGLYFPGGDDGRPVLPEYSTAEARVKAGRYTDAVEEYRKVIAQHPDDIYAHIRIAELAVDQLNDLNLAELELLSATAKGTSNEGVVLAANKLADLYHDKLQQPARALEVMEQLKMRLPGTKHAVAAQHRIDVLKGLAGRKQAPAPPKKIAFKPTDEETLRKRRGY